MGRRRKFKSFVPRNTAVDESTIDPMIRSKAVAEASARAALISPKGALGLPKLLDQRRLEWQITDGAFATQPFFDRVFVYQVEVEEKTAGGLFKPQTTMDREQKSAPQGILVAAGAKALDDLHMNGIELGHFVQFVRVSPYRIQTDHIPAGGTEEIMVLRAGDIISSYDLGDALRARTVEIVFDAEAYQHYYRDTKTGRMMIPQNTKPFIGGDS